MKKNFFCPLCKIKQKKLLKVAPFVDGDKSKKKAFFLCKNCDVRYLFPRLSKKEEKFFYKKEFEKFMEKRGGESSGWRKAEDHIRSNKETFNRRMKYLRPHLKNKKKILEVGCSSGFMLFPLIKKGHHCSGIEPSGVFSKFLKKKYIEIYDSIDILKKKKKKFDLIIHFFVLEHISNPIEFTKTLLSLLKKNGKIIFEIPNVAEPLHTLFKIPEFEKFYWSIAHHWYFSEKSLKYVLDRFKKPYKIELDQRYDASNHIEWNTEGKPGGMKKYTSLLGEDLEKEYKNFLIKTGYCDTLIGIIKN